MSFRKYCTVAEHYIHRIQFIIISNNTQYTKLMHIIVLNLPIALLIKRIENY